MAKERIKTLQEVVAEEVFNKEFAFLKQELKDHKQITWQVILAVLIAFISIVVTVAYSVIYSNRSDKQFYSDLNKNIYNQNLKVQDLNNRLDNLKIRNSYLK